MAASKVYFTDFKTKPGYNMLDKLENLVKKAGIETIDFKNKFVAIKVHFGEPGNLAYIRPNYVARIVKLIKSLGGKPFVTDANTLYTGRRSNALDHLEAAYENGFNPLVLGCHVIIADGLKGTEYREIEVNLKHTQKAKIGSAIADADIIISMNHFKGHEMTGFGGAIKNIGMGSGSRGGKLFMHSSSKPVIKTSKCVGCGMCVKSCAQLAITLNEKKKAVISYEKCVGCGQCVAVCQFEAATVKWDEAASIASEKIAEYAYAVLKDKPHFHVNFIMNISPDCDCWSHNDIPIAPDIGIAASFDPVALDKACVDLVNSSAFTPAGSVFEKAKHIEVDGKIDRFKSVHPDTDWRVALKHAQEIGLGSLEYELVKV
ncbi:DUF362 domain-containing protein [Caldicellulosiruptor naganoensis]|uniref:DUF362 domain-containing protein n=1 Tax=Caldicellulosiruptor naganoensis TaxID=29324 RepID=A0ABY7BEI9_9FIRM|nr:DUF362 domain-containing protein [Caldicellulosiruptor naganoensis]WAM31233.1 DUF362 domain-containing protein [Caldicellulosiruptor naganoensis]